LSVYFKGYAANNSVVQQPIQIQYQQPAQIQYQQPAQIQYQQPAQIQCQQSLNCQPGIVLSSSQCMQPQQQFIQQLPQGQVYQRPLSVGGGALQTVLSTQQSFVSPSNSMGLIGACRTATQLYP
jgi:hypothetical protein